MIIAILTYSNMFRMEDVYIRVKQPLSEGFVYIDIEDNDTLPLESLWTQFEGAIGLKFEFQDSFRGVRVRNGVLVPPRSGWDGKTYHVVFGDQEIPRVKKEITTESTNDMFMDAIEITDISGTLSKEQTVKKGTIAVLKFVFCFYHDHIAIHVYSSDFLYLKLATFFILLEPKCTAGMAEKDDKGQASSHKALKKTELRKHLQTSIIARTALCQWNKLNTAIRRQVYSVKVQCTNLP